MKRKSFLHLDFTPSIFLPSFSNSICFFLVYFLSFFSNSLLIFIIFSLVVARLILIYLGRLCLGGDVLDTILQPHDQHGFRRPSCHRAQHSATSWRGHNYGDARVGCCGPGTKVRFDCIIQYSTGKLFVKNFKISKLAEIDMPSIFAHRW